MEARGAGGGSLGVFGDRAVILECIVAAESLVSGKDKGESGLDDVSDVGDSGKPAAKRENQHRIIDCDDHHRMILRWG